METYRLTTRGKWVLGFFILLLIVGMVYSGKYIAEYFTANNSEGSVNYPNTTTVETTEITQSSQNPSEVTTEQVSETEIEGTTAYNEIETSTEEQIYSSMDLNDLKQFKIIFYFDQDQVDTLPNKEEFDALLAAIETYPNEKIVIEGHANGYPSYREDLVLLELSSARSTYIKEQLIEVGIELIDMVLINYGGERPVNKSFGEQHLNDRVEVYFGDHFIHDSIGK